MNAILSTERSSLHNSISITKPHFYKILVRLNVQKHTLTEGIIFINAIVLLLLFSSNYRYLSFTYIENQNKL